MFRVEKHAILETSMKQVASRALPLHVIISQKAELIITTAVRTSNPTGSSNDITIYVTSGYDASSTVL
jgi:hypothetical protein